MDKYSIEVNLNITVTSEDIDDIMATAREGGINYWCDKATVVGNYLGEFASEQIARGGTLKLHDAEENKNHLLTRDGLLKGIKMAIENNYFTDYGWHNGKELDTCNVDAEVADVIIQLAIFGDVVYG